MPVRDDLSKQLPGGTVTLLFADIEGSTRLLSALRADGFAPVRARLRELVRAAAAVRGGREVDWAGDGVFLAFPRATDAVLAAAELQRALEAEPWPPDGVVRLRIGIHTGEPDLGEEGYVGMDVVVASRICAASHGGQVVVSRATRDFVGDDLEGLSFRPLGSHRLKDVPGAEQLFQLVGGGLLEGFAPLRTLGGTALPALHHRLVGRRRDLSGMLSLLSRPEVRLVTLTGPGGAGKSRLALEIAALTALERPVHLVGLAPVSDPELVPVSIAHVLGVREGARPLVDCIAEALAGTGALLLLDNFEHLAPAAPRVAALLDRAPDLDVLVTSRAPLRLSAEHVVPLEPLPVHDAATLFSELAAARGVVLHDDALPAIREICRRLDGLPLAIELVAARLAVLPPAQLLMALDEGLTLDMEGPVDLPERQRTLRATIDWSYGLLSDSQRELHQALAVFSGGCTLDDARSLSGSASFLGDLEGLVVGSLLRSDVSDGEVRLFMLETVREDALARLAAAGRLEDLRERHAERFLELAASAEGALAGPDQGRWLDRLERELDNIRAALDWCLTSGRVEDALRAVSSLERFWRAHGDVSEARRWLSVGLGLSEGIPPGIRADALWTAARQATAQSDWAAAEPYLEDALELFRAQGRGREIVFALSELGSAALHRADVGTAEERCEEAIAIAGELGDPRAESGALSILAEVARTKGEHERALALSEEAVVLRRALGDPLLITDSTYRMGIAAFGAGDFERAEHEFEASLSLAHELGASMYRGAALCMLGSISLLKDDLSLALDRLHESLAIYTEREDRRSIAECLCALGGYAAATDQPEQAARLWGAADLLRGDSPLEYAEPVIESCFAPGLVDSLGDERFAELRAEGARVGLEGVLDESRSLVAPRGGR
jgi:predicted ATPase/class 3 adenylate cyclase